MKKILTVTIIGLLCLSLFSILTPKVKATETTIFSDDFESYVTGTFPSAGGWVLVFNGRGDQYQKITDVFSVSGSKSLQLWGYPNWSAAAMKEFATSSNLIGYDVYVRAEDIVGDYAPCVSFYNRDIGSWGLQIAGVGFSGDGTIVSGNQVLQAYVPDRWYEVKLVLNIETKTYSVWIDGVLRGQDLYSADADKIKSFILISEHAGIQAYFDDVKVFTQANVETTIFFDDFESYTVGTFPSSGGWELIYDGMGPEYQVVNSAVSVSGVQSFQLWGVYMWSACADRRFTSTSNVIGYEAYVMASEYGTNPHNVEIEFQNYEIPADHAGVQFGSDGKIYSVSYRPAWYTGLPSGPTYDLNTHFNAGEWYKIKVVVDKLANTYNIWINDILKGEDLVTQEASLIGGIRLVSGHAGVRCFFDDVKVFTIPQIPRVREARGVFIRFSAEQDCLFDGATDQVTETFAKQRIDELVQDMYSHNMNSIFVTFKGDGPSTGVLFYLTEHTEMRYPRFSDLYAQSFDPMEYLIEQSHSKGIEVHAWFPVFKDEMLIAHKDAFGISEEIRERTWADNGSLILSNSFVKPQSIAVQQYEFGLIQEVVSKYPYINGINLDFIRYDWYSPDINASAVDMFVLGVSLWLHLLHPAMILSADVYPDGQRDLVWYGQDIGGIAWLVDVLMPMTYHKFWFNGEPEWIKEVVENYTRDYRPRYIVPCIQAWKQLNQPYGNITSADVVAAVNAARDGSADGFALFTYESDKKQLGGLAALHEVLEGHAEVPWASTSASAIRITANSPVNTLVTAPNGLRVGYDSATHDVVNEIQGATYSGPGTEPQVITIPKPLPGDYKIDVFGVGTGSYAIAVESIAPDGSVIDTRTWTGETYPEKLESNSVPLLKDGNLRDCVPPWTTLSVGFPQYIDSSSNQYVNSETPFTLSAIDNLGGEGVASTAYRVYNDAYSGDWVEYSQPFYVTGLTDGLCHIDYNSTDNAGNMESTKTAAVILDNTAPSLTIEVPTANVALQDGENFTVSAWDLSAVASVTFSIQCPQGNVISPEFEDMPGTHMPDCKWKLYFDTTRLPDGYYLLVVNGTDVVGNWGITTVPFTIRNWAAIELLPASKRNQPGRTMPIKFSLRIIESVDPARPFVRNEELTIQIYALDNPTNILQTSTYGDTARDYRIDPASGIYITNFKTSETPKIYRVEIYRKEMLISYFHFSTYVDSGCSPGQDNINE